MSAIVPIEYPMKIILQNKEVLVQPGKVVFLGTNTSHRGCSCNTFKSASKKGVFFPLIRGLRG